MKDEKLGTLASSREKNTFPGQIPTKNDTSLFRHGNRPCEKGLAQATAGQIREKTGENAEKTGENGQFFKDSPE
jgi:hypothetical protein